MILFENFQCLKKQNYVKLSVEPVLYFERSGNEDYKLTIPQNWLLDFWNRINGQQYDLYMIYSQLVPHGQFNKLTDYKKIWGLKHIEKGEYENTFDTEKGRVYFGIKKERGLDAFTNSSSKTIVFMPEDTELDFSKVYEYCKKSESDNCDFDENALFLLQKIYQDILIVQYNFHEKISMSIFGKNIGEYFDDEFMMKIKTDTQKGTL